MKLNSVLSATATLVLAASAFAQPACTSLGTLSNPSVTTGTATAMAANETRWFCFDIPAISFAAGTFIDIDTNGGTYTGGDTDIGLYRADGTLAASNDDSGASFYSMLSFGGNTPARAGLAPTGNATSAGTSHTGQNGANLAAGTYYLAIGGFENVYGATGFTVTGTSARTGDVNYRIEIGTGTPPPPPPGNDECAGAFAATVGTNAFDNVNATASAGTMCTTFNKDVWYSFNPGFTGNARIATCGGTTMDTVVAAYDACGGTQIACSDDFCGAQSQIDIAVTSGVPVLIRIARFGTSTALGTTGTFTITDISSQPPSCTLALTSTSGPIGATTIARATVTLGTNPAAPIGSVSLNAANVDGGTVALLDNGDGVIDLVAGDNIFSGQVTVGALAANGAQSLISTVTDTAPTPRTSTCTATYTVVPPPPANDDCANAAVAVTGTNAYDTNGATTSTPASTCGLIGTDVWFTWNSGPGGETTVATCGFTTVDTAIAVYSDCATSIACDDDGCGGVGASTLTFCSAPNTNYLIRIGDFNGGNPHTGSFSIAQVPGSGSPTLSASATPTCGVEGTVVTITADLSNAGCPAQTLVSASADATVIGGGTVTLLDDGVAPDTAIDGVFTGQTTYGAAPSNGDIVVTGTFSGGGTGTFNIGMTTPGGGTDEAGDTLATALVLTGGPVSSITGSLVSFGSCDSTDNDVDMYKFQICDPASFSASTVGGTTMDTQLFLFNNGGFGVAVDDDCPAGTLQSCLSSAFVSALPAANYYLAIAGYNQDPRDAADALIWANTPFNVERAPDGPGAANALDHWDTGGFNSGTYTIALTGACGAAPDCHGVCVADFDDGSGTGTPDGGVTIDDLLYYLAIFEEGVICADVDDGSSTGTPDGGVTIDDLLYYLQRFEEGC